MSISATIEMKVPSLIVVVARRLTAAQLQANQLQAYLADQVNDSRIARQLALQSELPNQTRNPYRASPSIAGTSLLVSVSECSISTAHSDLPALSSNASSRSANEVDGSSIGGRAPNNPVLEAGDGGVLELPPPSGSLLLECPFNFLYCRLVFSNFQEWYGHSLTHFNAAGPPNANQCCFCEAHFESPNGWYSWSRRMEHVALHHHLGHRLSHAQPDFNLYNYLWSQKLIPDADYKSLRGESARGTHGAQASYPSPPASPNQPDPTNTIDMSTAYTITESRRARDRRPRPTGR